MHGIHLCTTVLGCGLYGIHLLTFRVRFINLQREKKFTTRYSSTYEMGYVKFNRHVQLLLIEL